VLVDIVTLKDGLPDKTLRRDDFQLFDNGAPVSIKTFDTGFQSSSRPLSLWMIVQCRMPGWDSQGSGLFAGEIHRLLPALEKLNQQDTIAVAHWCDNGDAQLDLMPTTSADNLGKALERVLAAMPNPKNHDSPGGTCAAKDTATHRRRYPFRKTRTVASFDLSVRRPQRDAQK